MTALSPGTILGGRYRLDKRIAGGGMGDVWCGHDDVLGRTVAVKVLLSALTEEPGFAERFRGEARTMATVNHAGVVKIYDYGSQDGTAYLVMEYVEGDALSTTLSRVGRLTPARTMALVAQAADALQAAHDKGIVHRDVKPANLLVRPDGTLVLTDFGIARSAMVGQLTAVGSVLGTAAYISPEQATGQSATPRSDLYALGVVAYQCLSGRRPFEGDNPLALAMRHLRDTPPPLPQDIPVAIRQVVERAMAKDPGMRWESARAFAAAARRAGAQRDGTQQGGQGGAASPGGTRVLPPVPGQNRPVSGGAGPNTPVSGRPVSPGPVSPAAGPMSGPMAGAQNGPPTGRFARGAAGVPAPIAQTRVGAAPPYPGGPAGYPTSPAPYAGVPAPRPAGPPPVAQTRQGGSSNTVMATLLAAALVLLLCLGGWMVLKNRDDDKPAGTPGVSPSSYRTASPKKTSTTTKPPAATATLACNTLRNRAATTVRAVLTAAGYDVDEQLQESSTIQRGYVIDISPCTALKPGDKVKMIVSTGPKPGATPSADCIGGDITTCPSSMRPSGG